MHGTAVSDQLMSSQQENLEQTQQTQNPAVSFGDLTVFSLLLTLFWTIVANKMSSAVR